MQDVDQSGELCRKELAALVLGDEVEYQATIDSPSPKTPETPKSAAKRKLHRTVRGCHTVYISYLLGSHIVLLFDCSCCAQKSRRQRRLVVNEFPTLLAASRLKAPAIKRKRMWRKLHAASLMIGKIGEKLPAQGFPQASAAKPTDAPITDDSEASERGSLLVTQSEVILPPRDYASLPPERSSSAVGVSVQDIWL